MNKTKQCHTCSTAKPVAEFYKNKGKPDGLASICAPCGRAYQAESLRRNPSSGKEAATKFRSTSRGRVNTLLQGARTRAVKDGIPCTIDRFWVEAQINTGLCAVTGIPFSFERDGRGHGYRNPFVPSLDQILPGKGYTPENTQVVVWTYNAAKGAASHEDVLTLARALCHVK